MHENSSLECNDLQFVCNGGAGENRQKGNVLRRLQSNVSPKNALPRRSAREYCSSIFMFARWIVRCTQRVGQLRMVIHIFMQVVIIYGVRSTGGWTERALLWQRVIIIAIFLLAQPRMAYWLKRRVSSIFAFCCELQTITRGGRQPLHKSLFTLLYNTWLLWPAACTSHCPSETKNMT